MVKLLFGDDLNKLETSINNFCLKNDVVSVKITPTLIHAPGGPEKIERIVYTVCICCNGVYEEPPKESYDVRGALIKILDGNGIGLHISQLCSIIKKISNYYPDDNIDCSQDAIIKIIYSNGKIFKNTESIITLRPNYRRELDRINREN